MSAFDDAQRVARARRDALHGRKRARLDRFLRGEYMVEYTYILETQTVAVPS